MSDPDNINRLIGEFVDLQEEWERDFAAFDWKRLEALAQRGAQAYNEGSGPSFHSLALDGVVHSEFHERFLAFSLAAGFDPFKVVHPGSGSAMVPVIDHSGLAESAEVNASSARMRKTLLEMARERFASLADAPRADMLPVVEACAESIPADLLARIAPELAKSHPDTRPRPQRVDPIEGYLSSAEVAVDSNPPYG